MRLAKGINTDQNRARVQIFIEAGAGRRPIDDKHLREAEIERLKSLGYVQ